MGLNWKAHPTGQLSYCLSEGSMQAAGGELLATFLFDYNPSAETPRY